MVRRVIVAVVVGLLATALCFWQLWRNDLHAGDFSWPLRAAEVLLAGQNPYTTSLEPLPYTPHHSPLWYPLPAVLVAIPFTLFPPPLAGGLFFGLGSGLLAFAVTKEGWWRLTMFLSVPYLYASTVAQWSPLIMAAFLLPVLHPIVMAKPNIGVPLFIAWPLRRAVAMYALTFGISLAILPTWTLDWLRSLESAPHLAPISAFGGILLLLAALR
jgi:hypothetical protein